MISNGPVVQANSFPFGLKEMLRTPFQWHSRVGSIRFPVFGSQKRTALSRGSRPPEARTFPSGLKLRLEIIYGCALGICRISLCEFTFHALIEPSQDAEA